MTTPSPAEQAIRERIAQAGRITFAEFMEHALYGPGGYYTRAEPIGRRGDFYTSSHAHPLFGALIAVQIHQMWRLLGSPAAFQVVELGAGDGRLALDVLSTLDGLGLPADYRAIERHPRPGGMHPRLAWQDDLPDEFSGCLLSNEFFDALPVHRLVKEKGRLLEVYVTVSDGRLIETLDTPSSPAIAERLEQEGVRLQDGWSAEVCLAASDWMRRVAKALQRGYVITIDYGDLAEDLYAERRRRGTLTAYHRHTPQEDLYARIGQQDLTAHVDFTSLIAAGKSDSLQPVTLMTQHEFLRNLGADDYLPRLAESTAGQGEYQANAMAVRDLLKLDGLGNFRVLIQAKGSPAAQPACLGRDEAETATALKRLDPLPKLSPQHLDLLAARYPHQARDWNPG